jgi:hypothetical protein
LFVEHMKAAAVEHKLERAAGRCRGEKVQHSKAATQGAARHLGVRAFDSDRRDIDPENVEAAFRHPDCIRAGPRPDLKRRSWCDRARSDELDELRLWLPGVPGQLAGSVAIIPGWV